MDNIADRVRRERLGRGWSVRQAAAAGGISNTYWGEFEDYKRSLTPLIANAVARAFGWPEDWADGVTMDELAERTFRVSDVSEISDELMKLTERVDALQDAFRALLPTVRELRAHAEMDAADELDAMLVEDEDDEDPSQSL